MSPQAIADAPILIANPEQQGHIAEVLGALDDKIEANERLVETARVLLAARFDALVAGRSGDWRHSSLGDELEVMETGSRPRGGVSRFRAGVPSLGAESVLGLAAYDYSKTKYVPDEFFESMKRGVVEDLDVLLYKDGGRPGEFEPHASLLGSGFPFPRFCINEHVYRLRVRLPLTQEFLYCWLSREQTMEEMRRRGTGVAIPGLNSSAVRGLPIDVPPSSVLEEFSRVARPLVQLALEVAKESRILAELRDTLLPPLISGQLRVRDAEAVVGDAT